MKTLTSLNGVLINIKGVTFTFKDFYPYHNGKTLNDLYKKPSAEKIAAWKKREGILDGIYGAEGNSNTFTIYGYITDENGIERDVKITRWNNYILSGRRF